MENDLTRLSLLAIDIADPEIRSLQETYEGIEKSMVKAGIPAERMRLIAQSVKFPTAEAMFDFINQKYGEYLIAEGAKLELPPVAGNHHGYSTDGWRSRQKKSPSKSNLRLKLLSTWNN